MPRETRDRILQSAFIEFLRRGYREVSMNDLVKISKLTKGAFYHYFPSKEALYRETLDRFFFAYFDNFELQFDAGKPLRQNLEELCRLSLQMDAEIRKMGGNAGTLNYYLMVFNALRNHPEYSLKMEAYYQRFRERLKAGIGNAMQKKEIASAIEVEVLAEHLLALLEGMMLLGVFDTGEQLKQRLDAVLGQFYELIRSPAVSGEY